MRMSRIIISNPLPRGDFMNPLSPLRAVLATALLVVSAAADAAEYPIGTPAQRHGMDVRAVYLQPIRMEPKGMMPAPEQSDIHLEADIHALAGNPNGYEEGAWIPYLKVTYVLTKLDTRETIAGELMPMVANDGPHYGDNVKLKGPGKYQLTFTVYPPNAPENASGKHYGRHTDRETGVRPWFPTFRVDYGFTFAGAGKKGSY
ncbi:MAG: iron transporter [Rhodospirillales bacterium]|nr:iron transporter [Rhodospirillales bacterium]